MNRRDMTGVSTDGRVIRDMRRVSTDKRDMTRVRTDRSDM
jgi:hypothetical protein